MENNNGPFGKINVSRGIQISFWKNEREKDGRFFLNVQISKSYQDNGEWKRQSINMRMNDLYRLLSVGSQVKDIEEMFREEVRSLT